MTVYRLKFNASTATLLVWFRNCYIFAVFSIVHRLQVGLL